MVNLSHTVLRLQRPNMEPPYRTPGGKATTGVGLTLSCVVIASTFFVDTSATFAVVVLVLGVVYFSIYAKSIWLEILQKKSLTSLEALAVS